jgi:ribonuclease HI
MDEAKKHLSIYVDGASRGNPGPAGIGVSIEDGTGTIKAKISHYIGKATNNQAEYKALIMGLREAVKLGAEHINIKTDSELLAEQIRGNYKVRSANLMPLFRQVKQLLANFESFDIASIPRRQNATADALANQALDSHH